MKTINRHFCLLAAAMLTAGAANAQTTPNTRPNAQGRTEPSLRTPPENGQIGQTLRSAAIDNQSYVSQTGYSNFGTVTQTGNQQVADMVQVNGDAGVTGNDGYQTQSNASGNGATAGVVGHNDAYLRQNGSQNYADQVQVGNLNTAVAKQGLGTAGSGARNANYVVQDQTGANNYGYASQESNRNFAHQKQTSDLGSSINSGGLSPSSPSNGNYAVTLQGGGAITGTNGSDGQWSQTIQNGQNNRAVVSQDH